MLNVAITLFFAGSTIVFGVRRVHAYLWNKSAPSVAVTTLIIMTGIVSSLRVATTAWPTTAEHPSEGHLHLGLQINSSTHLSRFFLTTIAFGLACTLALVVARTYGVVESGLKKLACATLIAAVACVPAASWWITSRSLPAIAYALMARGVCYFTSSYVLSASTGNSWFSVMPVLGGMIFLLGWLELHRSSYYGEGMISYFLSASRSGSIHVLIYEWTQTYHSVALALSYSVAYSFASSSFAQSVELPLCMPRFSFIAMKRGQSGEGKVVGPTFAVMLAFVGRALQTLRNEPFRLEAASHFGVSNLSTDGLPRGLLAAIRHAKSSHVTVDYESLYSLLQGVFTIGLLVCASVVFPSAKRTIQKGSVRQRPNTR